MNIQIFGSSKSFDSKKAERWFKERNIVRLPTCLLLNNGEEIGRFSGFQPTEILEIWLDAKISKIK